MWLFKKSEENKLFDDAESILENSKNAEQLASAINPLYSQLRLISYKAERIDNLEARVKSRIGFLENEREKDK